VISGTHIPNVLNVDLAYGSDAKMALEHVGNSQMRAGYKLTPLKLFSKVSTYATVEVELTAKHYYFPVRIARFFKAIVSLYDLKGPAKLFIVLPWAVLGAILGRIMVTCEVDIVRRVNIDTVNTFLDKLHDGSFDPAKTTLSEAIAKLSVDSAVANGIKDVFRLASEEEDLPIGQHNFDVFDGYEYVNIKNEKTSELLEALLAITIFFDVKIRLFASHHHVIVSSTSEQSTCNTKLELGTRNHSFFADTTGQGEEIMQAVGASLDESAQKEFAIGDRTLSMYAGKNAQRGPMQCFLPVKLHESPECIAGIGVSVDANMLSNFAVVD
jgi:hypothetical protein